MINEKRNRVYLTDGMVLIGLGIGAAYWIIDCFLYIFLAYEINFLDRLFGPDLSGLSTRIIVICLFLIFGSHAQFQINKQKLTEAKLSKMKEVNEKLKQEFEALKNQEDNK